VALVPTRELWTLALNAPLAAPPAYDSRRVFFPIDGDRLVAYDVLSGRQLWLTSARVVSPPAAGGVHALRASDGHEIWQRDLSAALHARPALAADRIYAPLANGRVAALQVETG